MPPRLNHRKSSKGCIRCKKRKVKCDESHPECRRCLQHGVSCEYPPFQPRRWASAKRAMAHHASPDTSERLQCIGSSFMKITDVLLMHHYVTETTGTMSSSLDPTVKEMWCIAVPQMAFEEHGLLHTLLAIAAAHRATLIPSESVRLHIIHQTHMDLALQRHQMMVVDVSENGAPISDTLCLNSILISLYVLGLRSMKRDRPYELPMQWLYLSRGIRVLMRQAFYRLLDSGTRIQPLLAASAKMLPSEIELNMSDEALFDFLLESAVPGRFIQLLSEKKPRALVILAYHFALVHCVQNIWFLSGIPAQEVRGINNILPPKWKWAMTWPLRVTDGRKMDIGELATVN
ncbi:hypothetical protein F9C07_2217187 [Aspergillus flavus]|uniref:Zn(2)-C6 fungal-type domain-containing protein n=2 Tax=Aspergillus subgen. Circumdati TaxID=2720871 RepID=A0A7U2MCV8_ASPFN|nr:hypothetical protein Ao3042_07574 [Aspergillus oryzae 3.042]KDE77243.1 hypothetical protein AO1008_03189 [Aspergillus oryzae 100-8]QRD81391.1 hypothetical protein F9C07_2217187 [Aspergillus flavus]|eukprot:EIT76289.1 hypothetical protein Ao3042_07574 [Aspergillus oryzae 3.042]